MKVEIVECTSDKETVEEIVFVHGWPDSGDLWEKQVEFLKKDYRCLVVTLPNHSGDQESFNGGWGYSPE